jgi:hypothetical protein
MPDHAILCFPYVLSVVGDEPGLKDMIGYRTGGCNLYCIQCKYRNNFGMYDPALHVSRDYVEIKRLCVEGEMALARKVNATEKTTIARAKKETAAFKKLSDEGIYPMENAFHHAPMGVG